MEEPWDQRRTGTEPDHVETDSQLDQNLDALKEEERGQEVFWKVSQLLHHMPEEEPGTGPGSGSVSDLFGGSLYKLQHRLIIIMKIQL